MPHTSLEEVALVEQPIAAQPQTNKESQILPKYTLTEGAVQEFPLALAGLQCIKWTIAMTEPGMSIFFEVANLRNERLQSITTYRILYRVPTYSYNGTKSSRSSRPNNRIKR